MRKFLFILAFAFVAMANAQETPKFVYAEIVGESKLFSNKVTVSIDYGQATSFFESNKVKSEDGKNRQFNSMVDAMNYMGALGWEFQQAYVISMGQQNVYHWLMRKPFSEIDGAVQQEMIKNFPTKRDLR